ncbi:hypothetical protein BRADI_1g57002v3 [Brachypodium distachyon]|uniref:Uncharacterized protein n=1 Tax=Brachypodium distachyon TaxID=15368 RepID=A0A2K2DRY8_BRADI|nr:hypothetical protein BRADI_1g57002v3 [Brachypodium distachyon]
MKYFDSMDSIRVHCHGGLSNLCQFLDESASLRSQGGFVTCNLFLSAFISIASTLHRYFSKKAHAQLFSRKRKRKILGSMQNTWPLSLFYRVIDTKD